MEDNGLSEIKRLLEKNNLMMAREISHDEEKVGHDGLYPISFTHDEDTDDVVAVYGVIVLRSEHFIRLVNTNGKDISKQIKDGNALPLMQGESVTIHTGVFVEMPKGVNATLHLTPSFVGDSGLVLTRGGLVKDSDDITLTVTNVRRDPALVMLGVPMAYMTPFEAPDFSIHNSLNKKEV